MPERYRPSEIDRINLQFAFALTTWQKFPDNPVVTEMVSSLIDEGYGLGSLRFAISDAELKIAEGA